MPLPVNPIRGSSQSKLFLSVASPVVARVPQCIDSAFLHNPAPFAKPGIPVPLLRPRKNRVPRIILELSEDLGDLGGSRRCRLILRENHGGSLIQSRHSPQEQTRYEQ